MDFQGIFIMTGKAVLYTVPLFICWFFLRLAYLYKAHKPIQKSKELPVHLFAAYLICLLEITVIRFHGIHELAAGIFRAERLPVQWIPFATTIGEFGNGIGAFLYHLIGNLIWFIPFGFLIPVISRKYRNVGKIIILSAALSFGIELMQWVFGTGVSDIDDILCNTAGGLIGFGCYAMVVKWKERKK